MKSITIWEYSVETEAKRLIHCAHQLSVGFYRVNNFIVLPHNPKIKNANFVTFPNLSYNTIPRFWEKVKKIDIINLPIKTDKAFLESVLYLMKNSDFKIPVYQNMKTIWSRAEKILIDKIYEIIPSKRNSIKKIVIHPTVFGTSSSFNWINKKGEIIIYLREDQGVSTIVEAVITALTRKGVYDKLGGMWQESELLTDWLVTESSIANVIKKFDKTSFLPTLKGVRVKEQAKLITESDNFYKKLGLPFNQKVFGLKDKIPEINKIPVENLTYSEKELFRILIQKNGNLVSIDEIGDLIFKSEDNFSLYAIAKTVQRLRNKLEANGVSGSYIQTLRGKGYLLKN